MPPSYYYRCGPPRLPGKPTCRPNHVRAHPLDELVWQVRKHLLDPKLLVLAQRKDPKSQMLDSSLLSSQIENAQRRLTRVGEERRRILDAYQCGFLDKQEFEDRASTVTRRIETLQKELQALEEEHQSQSEGHKIIERLCGVMHIKSNDQVRGIAGVTDAHVEIVWEPPWSMDKMSDTARLQLGLM